MPPSPACFVLARRPSDRSQVLLVWHRRTGRWSLPGGRLEEGEAPAETAARELLEETGFEAKVLELLHVGEGVPEPDWPGREPRDLHVFELRFGGIPEALPVVGPEGTALRWGPLEELRPFFGGRFVAALAVSRVR